MTYINEFLSNPTSQVKLFAGNSKVYKVIRSQHDVTALQSDLNTLEYWSELWQLNFNVDKCETMRITHKKDNAAPDYHLLSNSLEVVKEMKDLGVHVIFNLSWSTQVNKCVNKGNKILGFLKRNVGPGNPLGFSRLYTTLVRPILEYCVSVWSPHLMMDIEQLENVQRRASKCALGLKHKNLCYEDRSEKLGWPTSERRRLYLSLIKCYKTIHEVNGLDTNNFFKFAGDYRPLRAKHSYKLWVQNSRFNSFKYSFLIGLCMIGTIFQVML